jgi:AcrR family transcriptional regulator
MAGNTMAALEEQHVSVRRRRTPSDPNEAAEPSKRERILREAERLFALRGFHGASLRDIAKAAGVGLSIVVYHFDTKQGLYRAAFERHLWVLDQRIAELNAVTDFAAPDAVERIVAAFVMPVLRLQAAPQGGYYPLLTVREASDPQEAERGITRDYYDPMARQFIAALQRALPNTSPEYLHWAYLFSVGALVMNSFDERMARLSENRYQPGEMPTKARLLIAYIAAGIRGGPDK